MRCSFILLLCSLTAVQLRFSRAGFRDCMLSIAYGSCEGYFPKWFYNSTSRKCETFIYGGCQGNPNRFETRESCESACICDRCLLQPETGPCRAAISRYFYNRTSGNCEEFTYGGCDGNDNRFETAAECIAHCSSNSACLIKGQKIGTCPSCQPTCSNPWLSCSPPCNEFGCVCTPGLVVDTEANKCVDLSECPVNCSNVECPDVKCAFGNPTIPEGACCPVCLCRDGGKSYLPGEAFRKDCNGCTCTDTGLAICTMINCGPTRPPPNDKDKNRIACSIEGQEYTECGTACPPTCKSPSPLPCTKQCVPGCQCPRGTVLDEENNKCVEHCSIPPCERDTCSLQPETGLCNGSIPSYYWNVNTRQCEEFIYGGCGGNSNRFSTMKACANKCSCSKCPVGSQCKMYEETGEQYCEPSCEIANGGCPPIKVCTLNNITCVRDPCPPVVECKCPIEGQVYLECGTACPPTCKKPGPSICTQPCVRECQCPSGTVLDEAQNK